MSPDPGLLLIPSQRVDPTAEMQAALVRISQALVEIQAAMYKLVDASYRAADRLEELANYLIPEED